MAVFQVGGLLSTFSFIQTIQAESDEAHTIFTKNANGLNRRFFKERPRES
jgi:hypothetical protein